MSRRLPSLAVLLVLSACGGPTSPDGGGSAIQSLLNSATPDIKINGVTVQPGSTTDVAIGNTVGYQINYTNRSGQVLHTAVAYVRDDGAERVAQCGATGSGGDGGGFGSSTSIFRNDSGLYPGTHGKDVVVRRAGCGSNGAWTVPSAVVA